MNKDLLESNNQMDWIELNWIELNWIELNWIELNWIELNWIELNWIELNWIELNWIELNWIHKLLTEYINVVDVCFKSELNYIVSEFAGNHKTIAVKLN